MTQVRSAALLMVLGSTACAQGWLEFQPFAGYRFGGTIQWANSDPAPATVRSSWTAGASVAYHFPLPLAVELLWAVQPTTSVGAIGTRDIRVHHILVNGVFEIPVRRSAFRPFAYFGMGASRLSGTDPDRTRVAWNVGGGVNYFVSRHLGLRLQMRLLPTILYITGDGYSDCRTGVCQPSLYTHTMNQGEIAAGLVFRVGLPRR